MSSVNILHANKYFRNLFQIQQKEKLNKTQKYFLVDHHQL